MRQFSGRSGSQPRKKKGSVPWKQSLVSLKVGTNLRGFSASTLVMAVMVMATMSITATVSTSVTAAISAIIAAPVAATAVNSDPEGRTAIVKAARSIAGIRIIVTTVSVTGIGIAIATVSITGIASVACFSLLGRHQ